MTAKAGRPRGNSGARQQLIIAARQMFTVLPYEKVSTRMIAEDAGVSPALINYYFGGKAGLFEQMLRETLEPVRNFLDSVPDNTREHTNPIEVFMRTFYSVFIPNPDLPKLIMRVMSDPSASQISAIESLLKDMIGRVQRYLFSNTGSLQGVKSDMDPLEAKMTVMSLTILPFVAPKSILELHGFSLDEDFLNSLLEHNIRVLKTGMLDCELES
tara:strand:- start:1047 stop:1688 length:642 start_codon:yes stop_codon:yes gene_type:complete